MERVGERAGGGGGVLEAYCLNMQYIANQPVMSVAFTAEGQICQ